MTPRIAFLLLIVAVNFIQKPDGTTRKHNSAPKDQSSPSVTFVDNRTAAPEENRAQQQSPNWYATSAPAEWALFVAGTVGVIVALCTLKAINRQVDKMGRQEELIFEQIKAMHKQITEMSEQTDVLKKSVAAMERGQRPWLSLDAALKSPVTYDDAGAHVIITFRAKNVGHLPAFGVWIDPVMHISGRARQEPTQERDRLCKQIAETAQIGSVVFPGETLERDIGITGAASAIEEQNPSTPGAVAGDPPRSFNAEIVAVVGYKIAPDEPTYCYTGVIYDIYDRNSGLALALIVGENSPIESLSLELFPIVGVIAT